MLNTLKNLGLAMLNATLILIVLALFLAWRVTSAADQIAQNFAGSITVVEPLRADMQAATMELTALRSDLAQISAQSGEVRAASLQRIEIRLDQMAAGLQTARRSLSELSQMPTTMVDLAIDSAVDKFVQGAKEIRACEQPQS